jgi:SAM-dependent methyltransferase
MTMTLDEFKKYAAALAKKVNDAGVTHDYFRTHANRLHQCAEMFDLFSAPLGDVLEIGPFFGYMPFILRSRSTSYSVLEGDDPVVRRLDPLYQEYSVNVSYVDLGEVFGPLRSATHRLDFPNNSFNTILCWETMEHFNFNPVKLVREFHRVLKPGGRICVTVPNKASWQRLAVLLTGKGEDFLIDDFYKFEEYEIDGKKAFHGYHWREYSPPELRRLFAGTGFKIQAAGSFNCFQPREKMGFLRRGARALAQAGSSMFPRHKTHVYMMATK